MRVSSALSAVNWDRKRAWHGSLLVLSVAKFDPWSILRFWRSFPGEWVLAGSGSDGGSYEILVAIGD